MTRRRVLLSFAAPLACTQEPVFTAGTSVVNLLATVHDRKGTLVTDLERDDFLLEEQGRRQELRYFNRQSGLPLALGILIDVSTSLTKRN
jgi:hypothetical protein